MINIKTGDVANCYTRDTFISKTISKVTNSEFSHTAIFLWVNGVLNVADSQKDGFNVKTYDNWMKDHNYKFLLTRTPYVRTNHILTQVDKYKGTTPYDFFSFLVRQPIRLIKMWSNRKLGTKFKTWNVKDDEDARMICSEIVAKIIGAPNYYEMTPKDVLIWQLDNGYNIVK